ncbi:hypothetical protein H9Y04_18790 [Streptomyces sp. TRM66268-LWL]|uniref:Secreted protein n=1 Tax=Streptomyces polyasparticus TaxID=2767826 RepID=A0ABR7SJU2_9ACTN|nr:hypothetical protein [Streptomyces polyasparticus]MBC9714608.1 hypothetical protein [Streptomyces polyasparticus]
METAVTAAALVALIAVAAYVIHRLNEQHAERIALRTYSRYQPGHRPPSVPEGTGPPPVPPFAPAAERHDHRDGGRGRHPARRRRERPTHKQAR